MADEADVGALGGLDRAHPAVVGGVHVSNLEPGPLPGQTAGAHGREAPLVGKTRQRVGLVHELRQLGRPEELLDRRHHRADVDQGLRGDGLDVLGGHALAHDPLHSGQADADLVLDQLADRTDAPVGEVVLVVEAVARLAVGQVQQVACRRPGSRRGTARPGPRLGRSRSIAEQLLDLVDLGAELAVELVPADPGQVVALRVEEGVLEVGAGGLDEGGSPGRARL